MNRILKYCPVIVLVIIISHSSCRSSNNIKELTGLWESISIENPSPVFSKTLPSYEKGEILLTLSENSRFIWNNTREKDIITGKFRFSGNNLYLDNDKESSPLKTEYKYNNNKLIIITDDGFSFTFRKKRN